MVCSHCGREVNSSHTYLATNGRRICISCVNEHFSLCVSCGYFHEKEKCFPVEASSGRNYACESCYQYYRPCSICGELTHSGRDSGEELYCLFCSRQYSDPIDGYHDSHNRSPIFFDTGKTDNPLYLGIELEVDKGDDRNVTARSIKAQIMPKKFIFMETDGSLSDDGFENITQPATLDYHLSIADKYEEMFKLLVRDNFRSHDTNSCGLHIHFNRNFFQDEGDICIVRLLYLVEKFWDNFRKFSRRTQKQLDSWARRYNNPPEEVLQNMKDGQIGRYYAINLSNTHTIEFRLFRGTLKLQTFIATLQLVDTIVRKVKSIESNEELQSITWEDFLVTEELKTYWETVKDREPS